VSSSGGLSTAWRLRDRLGRAAADGPVIAPGAYDALSARLIGLASFDAVYLTGFGAAASMLGKPDIGLLTGTEMADQTRRLTLATDLPLIADADNGYGNALNVAHTVTVLEQAGVAAIQIEDQVSPKRCGHMSGKELIPTAEMAGKIRAAVDARRDPDLVLIARTDAIAVDGIDEAIQRARTYQTAGADALFVEAPPSEPAVERIAGELAGDMPLVFNWVEGGRTPMLSYERIAELGFAAIIFPVTTLFAATAGVRAVLSELTAAGTPPAVLPEIPTFEEFTRLVGLPELRAQEARYAVFERSHR
jgi:2,3-dimethylmalate lyase